MTITTTSSSLYVNSSSNSISVANIQAAQFVVRQPIQKFIHMKRHVDTARSTFNQSVPLANVNSIDEYMRPDAYLYYVDNRYSDDYYGQSVTLHGFRVEKQTRCYYTLSTGQRINRKLTGRTFGATPSEAMIKATQRANNYLRRLLQRGRQVAEFVGTLDPGNKYATRELRDFEKLCKSVENIDDIPTDLFKDNAFGDIRLKQKGISLDDY
jgi:hypothetical protein